VVIQVKIASFKLKPLAGISARGLGFGLLLVVLGFFSNIQAQNLVKNPSFEEFNDSLNFYLYAYQDSFPGINNWFTPLTHRLGGVASYRIERVIHRNLNLVFPRTDSAHAIVAIGSSWRVPYLKMGKSFVQTQLKSPLEGSCPYYTGFYYIFRWTSFTGDPFVDDSIFYAANRLGLHLSASRIRELGDTTANGNPQIFAFNNQGIVPQVPIPVTGGFYMDTTQYALAADTLIAQGGEEFLTIGNFYAMNQTFARSFATGAIKTGTSPGLANHWRAVAYVDDVFVIPLPPPDSMLQSTKDTSLCLGESLTLSASSPNPNYSFVWDNGDTSATRTVSQPGTYWVKLLCGCTKTLVDTIVVEGIAPLTTQHNLGDTTLCTGETLNEVLDPSLAYWLNGAPLNTASMSIGVAGTYTLQWTNGCDTAESNFTLDYFPPSAFPALSLDSTQCELSSYTLAIPPVDSLTVLLNNQTQTLPLTLSEYGEYTLSLASVCDTMRYAFSYNQDNCLPEIFIPNAFTPNGDGLNDFFTIALPGEPTAYSLMIFNRWGQRVFATKNASHFWNGTVKGQPVSGTYTYFLQLTLNGYTQKYEGVVNVLR
jgi:gliding motility-associated-like protein